MTYLNFNYKIMIKRNPFNDDMFTIVKNCDAFYYTRKINECTNRLRRSVGDFLDDKFTSPLDFNTIEYDVLLLRVYIL